MNTAIEISKQLIDIGITEKEVCIVHVNRGLNQRWSIKILEKGKRKTEIKKLIRKINY